MTTVTLTLAEFLLARIAEDERWARTLTDVAKKHADAIAGLIDPTPLLAVLGDADVLRLMADRSESGVKPPNDLAQVLAECEAKRRIVEWAETYLIDADASDPTRLLAQAARQVLEIEAAPYVAHPDYPASNAGKSGPSR